MEITVPHKYQPRLYQIPILKALDNGIKRAVLIWNRRSGKDKTCFNYMVKRAVERVGTYFYFLPTYSQAKKVIWDNIDNDGFRMIDHIPREIIKSTNATELKVELVNGSIIQLIGADVFHQSGVGTNPIGVVFSEYSLTASTVWKYVAPILAANGGWAIFNFTPRGKNHAWELLQRAKDDPVWFTEILTVDDTKSISPEALEIERKSNPEAFFRQEYYCAFTENAGQFFRRVIDNTYDAIDGYEEDHDYQIGVDLAKYQDYTVITPFDLTTFEVKPQERFNQVDWNLQKARIEAAANRYRARIKIDRTGVGDPVVEDLRARGLNIGDEDSIVFTEVMRTNLLNNLAMLIEQDKIKIPNDSGLIDELESFQYVLTERGKIRIQCGEGLHDDRVMSLALAVWGVSEPLGIPRRNRLGKVNEFKLYSTTYD